MMKFHANDVLERGRVRAIQQTAYELDVCEKPRVGYKLEKFKTTFLAACNSRSTEKLLLMVEGRTWKSRPLNGRTRQELGFDYGANKKT